MSDQSQIESRRDTSWPFILQKMPEALQVQMEAWFDEQAALFGETQKMLGALMKRRQEAMDAAFQTVQAACNCKDAGSLAEVYGDWLTSSVNRIKADLNDAGDEALRLVEMARKSAAALRQQGAREKAGAAIADPVAAETRTRWAKDVPLSEPLQASGERNAAE
jgi:hypothetical protein